VQAPRFYCPQLTLGQVALDPAEARHALRSLRLRAGDPVTLFDGRGRVAHGRLAAQGQDGSPPEPARRATRTRQHAHPVIVVTETVAETPPPRRTLTLLVAACKGPRLDFLVEKCTELGVTRLVLTEFTRGVVHIGRQRAEKLRRTAIAAGKQCGRSWLPKIEVEMDLPAALRWAAAGFSPGAEESTAAFASFASEGRLCPCPFVSPTSEAPGHPNNTSAGTGHPREAVSAGPAASRSRERTSPTGVTGSWALLVAHPVADAPRLGQWLARPGAAEEHVVAVVGPEGGITPAELARLHDAGGQFVRLGEHVLRVETAAIAVAAAWATCVTTGA
jgi:16S rRNA U1498 N3-methylase RsmE